MSIAIMKRMVPAACLILALATQVSARADQDAGEPRTPSTAAAAFSHNTATHRVGKLALACTNHGTYGTGFSVNVIDPFTGSAAVSCEYPIGSGTQYTFSGAFWVGAVVGRDTLVSVGADGWQTAREMEPLEDEFGGLMVRRSILDPSSPEFEGALSQEDFVCKYADTASNIRVVDRIDVRPHRPLGIEVTERSFAWSYDYAEDFVLFDYSIKNTSSRRLSSVYMGIYCDADVGGISEQNAYVDDVCGFLETIPSPKISSHDCEGRFLDTVKSAWIADNDGDFNKDIPVPHVTATRVVRTPAETLNVSFNWWISSGTAAQDFGPMRRENARDLSTGGLGTPEGDRNKYFYLRNGEFDYDQVFTMENSSPADSDFAFWLPAPSTTAGPISRGIDTRYLLSFGPFNLDPGQTVPISFCYVGGQNFHRVQNNFSQNLQQDYRPHTYYANLDFEDLGLNSLWAGWLYDNPGYDSDNDGYAGKYRICTTGTKNDTIYYEGDGVPDFRGAAPPEAPKLWLLSESEGIKPADGKLTLRFNGQRSENSKDPFSQALDFEGYRVYLGLDERPSSISVVTSYDFDNYNKYTYVTDTTGSRWELIDLPMSRTLIDSLYGFPNWDPLSYSDSRPWRNPLSLPQYVDSFFYFTKQDYNNSRLGFDTKIVKRFPQDSLPPAEYFSLIPDTALAKLPDSILEKYYTADGWMKYYEYELTIDNLLPTVPYYVNVTAFDFGAPSIGLGALETSPVVGLKVAFPQGPVPVGDEWVDQVYVYPNPYRIDGRYQIEGFEGRERDLRDNAPDRKRKINFANLPPKCSIRIFTLDGDLVKEISHDVSSDDPLHSHESWDMITRNTQLVVSGLYYWTVEDDKGNVQIGKLVVIM